MSWVINASKSKRNEVVPGTSAFFQNELVLSSTATRDNTKSMFDLLSDNMNHLGKIIKHLEDPENLWDELLDLKTDILLADDELSTKVDLSLLAPESNRSLPPPESNRSLPAPESNRSLPAPELNLSLAASAIVLRNEKPHEIEATAQNTHTSHQLPVEIDEPAPDEPFALDSHPNPAGIPEKPHALPKKTKSVPVVKSETLQPPFLKHSLPSSRAVIASSTPEPTNPRNPRLESSLHQASNPLPSSSPNKPYTFPNTSPNADLSFIPIASTINPNKRIISNPITNIEKSAVPKPSKSIHSVLASEQDPVPDFDESFQAISTAIRKSIAGKLSVSHNLRNTLLPADIKSDDNPELKSRRHLENYLPSTASSHIKNDPFQSAKKTGTYKTPKRTSVFVSLPAREPLSGISSHSAKHKGEDANNSSLLQRLEASKDDASKLSSSRRNTAYPEVLDSTYIRHSMKGRRKDPESTQNIKSFQTISAIRKNLITLDLKPETGPRHETTTKKPDNSANDFLRRSRNVFMNYASQQTSNEYTNPQLSTKQTKAITIPKLPVLSTSRSKSPVRASKSPVRSVRDPSSRSKSPVRASRSPVRSVRDPSSRKVSPVKKYSSASSRASSRSPTRYGRKADLEISAKNSPTDYKSMLDITPATTKEKILIETINRLLAPTTASAAKAVHSLNMKELRKTDRELRKTDHIARNKFLTTSLDPKNPPQLNMLLSKGPILAPLSPPKRSTLLHDDSGKFMRKEKIKSLMAERKEAATQRVKQKIVNPLTHKSEFKSNQKTSSLIVPEQKSDIKANQRLTSNYSAILPERKSAHAPSKSKAGSKQAIHTKLEPAAILNSKVSLKPTKRPNEHLSESELKSVKRPAHGNSAPLPDEARGIIRRNAKMQTPSYKRNAAALDSAKTTPKPMPLGDILTTTPRAQEPDELPEIFSDDDDHRRSKYLRVWASTPELRKIMEEKKHVDPVTIFGEVPPLNMDDIFESQASRLRGRPSPTHSPGT